MSTVGTPQASQRSDSPRPSEDGSNAGDSPRTYVAQPRRRAFLPLTLRDRMVALAWAFTWQTLFRWSPPPVNWWRLILLRIFGVKIHGKAYVSPSARIEYPWNLELHDGVFIAHKVIINCMGKVTIGPGTRISQYSHLCAGTHDYTRSDMEIVRRDITIGSSVWIAADAFVGPGVTVGDGAILAARSSAFKDVPAGQVCAGEPARPIKGRDGYAAPAVELAEPAPCR